MQFPPDITHKQPLSTGLELLPFLTCVYLHGVLVMLPNTQALRKLLLPLSLSLAYHAVTTLDYGATAGFILGPLGYRPDRLGYINVFTVVVLLLFAARCIEFGLEERTHSRYFRPGEDRHLIEHPKTADYLFIDALELMFNHRNIGWSLARNPFPPPPPASHTILTHIRKTIQSATILDANIYIVQLLNPTRLIPGNETFFDFNYPLLPQLLHALLTLVFAVPMHGLMLDMTYNFCAIWGRLLLGQEGWQWPPLFDSPFLSESVAEFWQRRWQTAARRMFVQLGGKPGYHIGGKTGSVLGAFFVSSWFHSAAMWSAIGRFLPGPWLTMFMGHGVAIIMEEKFKELTGKQVGGVLGWIWTNVVVVMSVMWLGEEGYVRTGVMGSDFFPVHLRPGKFVVDTVLSRLRVT